MKKRIVLCADDYGQAPAISQGILSLLETGRLSAVSCLTNSRYFVESAKLLRTFSGQVDIGLHVNLTEGEALSGEFRKIYGPSLFSLSGLLLKSHFRRLKFSALIAECHAQLDRFIEAFGCLPNFVDGHQHIHQFPVVRNAFLAVLANRFHAQKAYVRLVHFPFSVKQVICNPKQAIIYLSGAKEFKKQLLKRNISYNTSFSGIYDFNAATPTYRALFLQFLSETKEGGIIMCHPALEPLFVKSLMDKRRYEEYQYLQSEQFLNDCVAHQVTLSRWFNSL